MTTETEFATGARAPTTEDEDRSPGTRAGAVIAVNDVVLHRGGLEVLTEVSFALGPGLHALVGANGAGKSTLLRALAGILAPSRGTIAIAGCDLWRDGVAARRGLGYLPESPEFFPYLTARELLETAASVRAAAIDRGVERFVEWVGEPALDRTIATLSAGQRRKLALAAATASEPPALLLDEPSNTLDAAALDGLRGLIEDARARGCCVVVAIHRPELLGLEFDRTLSVRGGRVE